MWLLPGWDERSFAAEGQVQQLGCGEGALGGRACDMIAWLAAIGPEL